MGGESHRHPSLRQPKDPVLKRGSPKVPLSLVGLASQLIPEKPAPGSQAKCTLSSQQTFPQVSAPAGQGLLPSLTHLFVQNSLF